MRSITKGTEPACLTETRRAAPATDDGRRSINKGDYRSLAGECKAKMRAALHVEQSGLCAYCCTKIRADIDPDDPRNRSVPEADRGHPERGGMSIEHWIPRSGFPDSDDEEKAACGEHSLDWSNLLGVCVGVALSPTIRKQLHCDQSRGSIRLSIHPAKNHNVEGRFKYNRSSGKMEPSDPGDAEAKDDIETLNLNTPRLMANRASAIDVVRKKIMRDDSPRNIKKLWRTANTPGPGGSPPYAPTVAWYLARKLRSRGIPVTDQ